jgi:hypothetical protein
MLTSVVPSKNTIGQVEFALVDVLAVLILSIFCDFTLSTEPSINWLVYYFKGKLDTTSDSEQTHCVHNIPVFLKGQLSSWRVLSITRKGKSVPGFK